MDIHPKKKEFLNQEAVRVASLLQRLDEVATTGNGNSHSGSIAQMKAIDLSDRFIGSITYTTYVSKSIKQPTAIKECEGQSCIGYDVETYQEFKKLVQAANKEKFVNNAVSEDALVKASFRWVVDFYKRLNVPNYAEYLEEFIEENTFLYKIYFPVPQLYIGGFFKVGKVDFEYFTEEYFNKVFDAILFKNPNHPDPDSFKDIRQQYQGRVFASYTVNAEKDKAVELAFQHCALAVDVLKTCSKTTVMPDEIVSFDIDSRVRFAPKSEVVLTRPHDISEFVITMTPDQYPYELYEFEWGMMHELKLQLFSNFLLELKEEKSELEELIINSIGRYSGALSERDLHKRIVDLYTILESLLIKDRTSPILDSVTKYLPMIVEKDIPKRRECAKLVRSLYDVRSGYIHHGKKMDFDVLELRNLQMYVVSLLLNLIIDSKKHNLKQAFLNEIDDAIMGAYS